MSKIKAVRATPVRVPMTRPATWAHRRLTHFTATIVEIETDDGLLGLGESRGLWSAPLVNDRFAPALVGLSTDDRQAIHRACVPFPFDYGYPERWIDLTAFGGVECALWDLAGQRSGLPLFRLLGGPVRDRAPFVAYAYAMDAAAGRPEAEYPDAMADIASQQVEATGARLFETKVATHSVSTEIAILRAIRDALPRGVDIAVDANMGFGIEDARRFLAGVDGIGLANIEEPVQGLGATARLRREFGIPVSTHCTDLDAVAAHPEIDSVVGDLQILGGISGAIEHMIRAAAMVRWYWLRARWETGIGWAAMCHVGIARPELDRPAQSLIAWVEDDLILGEPWLVRGGGVRPPEKPGLGVTLDRKAVETYAVTR